MTTPNPTPNNLFKQFAAAGKQSLDDKTEEVKAKIATIVAEHFAGIESGDISPVLYLEHEMNFGVTPQPSAPREITAGSSTNDSGKPDQIVIPTEKLKPEMVIAIRRIASPGEPDQIKVDADGTPSEIARLQKEVDRLGKESKRLTEELDTAKAEPKPVDQAELEAVKAERDTLKGVVLKLKDLISPFPGLLKKFAKPNITHPGKWAVPDKTFGTFAENIREGYRLVKDIK